MWPLISLELIAAVTLTRPLVLGDKPVSVALLRKDDDALRDRLRALRDDPARHVVLRIGSVTADGPSQASWEIHVGRVGAGGDCGAGTLVGVFSLYDQNPAAEYVFPIEAALGADDFRALRATFTPVSGIEVEGREVPVKVQAKVSIGEISLAVDAAPAANNP